MSRGKGKTGGGQVGAADTIWGLLQTNGHDSNEESGRHYYWTELRDRGSNGPGQVVQTEAEPRVMVREAVQRIATPEKESSSHRNPSPQLLWPTQHQNLPWADHEQAKATFKI